jgi:chorismate dehydratase
MNMDKKIKVGAVSYLNTKPLIYGFETGMMKDEVELIYDYPARIARMLLENEIDLGLVPVSIIPGLPDAHIITDYCIGSEGAIASVCLFSELPIENTEKVLLDYQSKTSVGLVKILLKEYWKLTPELIGAKEDFRDHIKGTTAGLVIGDRAFEQRQISPYVYDLGHAWKILTGLPFVFAAWVSNRKLPDGFIRSFNNTNKYGLEKINEIVSNNPCTVFDLKRYYTEFISYNFSQDKKNGMKLFLEKDIY